MSDGLFIRTPQNTQIIHIGSVTLFGPNNAYYDSLGRTATYIALSTEDRHYCAIDFKDIK